MARGVAAAIAVVVAIGPVWVAVASRHPATPQVHTRDFQSGAFKIDRVYRSMRGPVDTQMVTLGAPDEHRRIWITGLDVEALNADTTAPVDGGQRFICHVNFSYPDRDIWFTLIQGHYAITFPPGFAVPATTDQTFRVFSMAQNQDPATPPFGLKIRSRFAYVYDDELTAPMTPLNKFSWDIRVAAPYPFDDEPAKDGCDGDDAHHTEAHDQEPPAQPGEPVLHFAVPPRRHEYRTTLPGATKIPFDTTAHHISAHLHVYGQSLELIDKTAGRSLFTSRATSNSAKTGIVEMTKYASAEGIPIYRDHTYELVAVYDNTTDHVIDAMAVVYVYYKDRLPPSPPKGA